MGSERCQPSPLVDRPEESLLWGIVLVLGEIAERVEREQAHKQVTAAQGVVDDPREDAA